MASAPVEQHYMYDGGLRHNCKTLLYFDPMASPNDPGELIEQFATDTLTFDCLGCNMSRMMQPHVELEAGLQAAIAAWPAGSTARIERPGAKAEFATHPTIDQR